MIVGGLIRLYFDKKKGESEEEKKRKVENGVLYSSGLIAGEGLVGILDVYKRQAMRVPT